MADTAAHLVDRVFPYTSTRQWVLSFPFALRFCLAYDKDLCSAVLTLFLRSIFASLRRRARLELGKRGKPAKSSATNWAGRKNQRASGEQGRGGRRAT